MANICSGQQQIDIILVRIVRAITKVHKKAIKGHLEMAIFGGDPPNLEGIRSFDLMFCHDHLLTEPNISAEFERNR